MTAMQRTNGIVVGVVWDLGDPDGLGRVKVKYPHLRNVVSEWARLATLMAGGGRGAFFRPEKDDEVLVGFEHGDPRRPYILGSLWSLQDTPPADDGDAEKNNWRFIRSRSGHIVKLDDTKNAEKIEILDKDGSRMVVIDSAGKVIQIACNDGRVEVTASGDLSVTGDNVKVSAKKDLTLEAAKTGKVTISGGTVDINP